MRTRGWVLVPAGGNNVQEKAGFLLLVASVGHYQEKTADCGQSKMHQQPV